MKDLIYILPEIVLVLFSLLLLLVHQKKTLLVFLAVLSSMFVLLMQNYSYSAIILNDLLIVSPFTQTLKFIELSLVAVVLLMLNYQKKDLSNDLPMLISFSAIGMMGVISSNNLFSMYMAIELQSLPMYVMAAIDRKSLKSAEAGVKYFIMGALASGVLLYGISMLYGFTGSTGFSDLTHVFRSGELELGVLIGTILIISALAFKIAAAPFHMWAPDVYQGAPSIVTTFFASVPKIALVALLVRLFDYELVNIKLQQVLIFISIISLVVSALGALKQTDIKRLIAYSSIGHIGYVLMGIAAAMSSSSVSEIIVYITAYSIMNVGMFAVILSLSGSSIMDLRNIYKTKPLLSACLVVIILSMAGVPPTAGFFTKIYILSSAINSQLLSLALFALITSVISCYYYLRLIKIMYFDKSTGDDPVVAGNSVLYSISIVAALINITFFLYSNFVLEFLSRLITFI